MKMKKVMEVVNEFVCLVKKYEDWRHKNTLTREEVDILLRTVRCAGFEPQKVICGQIKEFLREQDGSKYDPYPINDHCAYKVIGANGKDDLLATGWLDDLSRLVTENADADILSRVAQEILNSIPLKPIILTDRGERLLEKPSSKPSSIWDGFYQYFLQHTRNKDSFTDPIGIHQFCKGEVSLRQVAKGYNALFCPKCGMRILLPTEIKTYGELRKFLSKKTS